MARSDPEGMEVVFEVFSDRPIRRVQIGLVDDDEPDWTFDLPDGEGRAMRGFRVKPVRNGTWGLQVAATDDQGCGGVSERKAVTVVY